MPSRPRAPSSGQRSRGKMLLVSISAARGAINSVAKSRTVWRNSCTLSPRSKSNSTNASILCARSARVRELVGLVLVSARLETAEILFDDDMEAALRRVLGIFERHHVGVAPGARSLLGYQDLNGISVVRG